MLRALLLSAAIWAIIAVVESVTSAVSSARTRSYRGRPPIRLLARTGGPFLNPAVLGTSLGIALCVVLVLASQRLRAIVACGTSRRRVSGWPRRDLHQSELAGRSDYSADARGPFKGPSPPDAHPRRRDRASDRGRFRDALRREASTRITSRSEGYARIVVQDAALSIIVQHPAGIGWGRFGAASQSNLTSVGSISGQFGRGTLVPHNSLLDAAVSAGILAAVSLAAMWLAFVRDGIRKTRLPDVAGSGCWRCALWPCTSSMRCSSTWLTHRT